ncbi:hypothetical protein JW948_00485 [bacterium]|nr:hypothetical protein [bacterium]
MRKKAFFPSMLVLFGSLFTSVSAQNSEIRVLYFHTSYRCVNCNNFEKWTGDVVRLRFQNASDSGRVVFKSINIEEKENEHNVQDYQLVTKSVILSEIRGDSEVSWKNLDQIWTRARNEKKFKQYIEEEIRAILAGDES